MRCLIIHNPASGPSSDEIYAFTHALAQGGDEVVMRFIGDGMEPEDAVADVREFDRVVVSGGDGTVSNVLDQMRGCGVPTLVFPSGTACLFFNNIGNAPEAAALAKACRAGRTVKVDMGELFWLDENGNEKRHGFIIIAGSGFDAEIMMKAAPTKNDIGEIAYFLSALATPNPTVAHFTIEHDGIVEELDGICCMAGNIGPSLLDTLTHHLDAENLPQAWVLELSSFQLDGVQDFAPSAAVVLNITQDHLDWHGSMAAYAAAKARVFGAQGCMVLNRQDEAVMAMLPAPVKLKGGKLQPRWHTTFGSNLPQQPGDFGLEEVNGMRWLVRAHDEAGPDGSLFLQRLLPADVLRIRGLHNACNALAALALAQAAGCPLAPLLFGLREYRGEPHRVQSLGKVDGIEYFDDSKGTNVGATVAALHGLGPQQRIVLILGGLGKGQDFAPLAAPVAQYVRAVVLIGRDAPAIRQALAPTGVALHDAADLPSAVRLARAQAQPGDAVLLSPACASMDMFRDYAHRAQVFTEAVQALAEAAGQVLEVGS